MLKILNTDRIYSDSKYQIRWSKTPATLNLAMVTYIDNSDKFPLNRFKCKDWNFQYINSDDKMVFKAVWDLRKIKYKYINEVNKQLQCLAVEVDK